MKNITLMGLLLLIAFPVGHLGAESRGATDPDKPTDGICTAAEGTDQCIPEEPYIPTPCEIKMNELWTDLQARMDLLLQDPICIDELSNIKDGGDAGVSPPVEISNADQTLVLVEKRAFKKLKRKARRNRCR